MGRQRGKKNTVSGRDRMSGGPKVEESWHETKVKASGGNS